MTKMLIGKKWKTPSCMGFYYSNVKMDRNHDIGRLLHEVFRKDFPIQQKY